MPDPRAIGSRACAAGLVYLVTLIPPTAGTVAAADVYHCVARDGSAVFSESPCGPDAELMSIEGHGRISGDGENAPSAIDQLRNYRQNVRDIEELVGQDEAPRNAPPADGKNPCARVTGLQMRNARVGKQVIKCHNKADVRAILGTPDSVYTWSDNKSYDTRWTYRQGDTWRYIFFRRGRVTRINSRSDE